MKWHWTGSTWNAMTSALHANEFEAVDLASFKATLNAGLQLKGDLKAGKLNGRVALSRAVLRLSDFIEYPTDVGWMSSPSLSESGLRRSGIGFSKRLDPRPGVERRDLRGRGSGQGQGGYQALRVSRQQTGAVRVSEYQLRDRPRRDQLPWQRRHQPDLYIIATRRIRLVSNENAVISVVVGGGRSWNPVFPSKATPPRPWTNRTSFRTS